MKIGRNDPCPCGSGKKYKKCCLKDGKSRRIGSRTRWELEDVEAMPTNEIITKLRGFGVDFDKDEFIEDVKLFYSAGDLSEYWFDRYPITASGFDEDFIWMATLVLWNRLAPETINSERLDDMMQDGYNLIEKRKAVEGCKLWLEVWDYLKERFTPEMKSIEDAEVVFSGMQSLHNWCQDLETELWNAGLKDPQFFEKRIRYCREFYQMFPETDKLIIGNMRRAEAQSYFMTDKPGKGDETFKAIIRNYPDWEWGYIAWGDMYAGWGKAMDLDRAEKIYRRALDKVSDTSNVLGRLKEVKKKRKG